ncbi:MAG: thiamine-phosphate kinase [Chloroflexota bacterium]|nr:thiamine-phosphate kinase [Chloroflexota bacterium]
MDSEFSLIARLRRALPSAADPRLLVGIGDDAAVWRDGGYTVATTDTMVEGVHFLRDAVPACDVGWKALAANISDIAAMGATPAFALVTLCLPPDTDDSWPDGLYAGIRACAEAYGVTVAGGDIVSSPTLTITIALAGAPTLDASGEPLLLRRDAARAGDVVAVSGPLGGSAGGLRVLRSRGASSDAARLLVARHMRPRPRVDVGAAAVRAGVRCAIDISDGLLQDLGHICEASGAGADLRLDDVPIDPALSALYPDDARTLAATGGEDYELVVVAQRDAIERVSAALAAPLEVVGVMTSAAEHRVRALDSGGREVRFERGGWDHLSRAWLAT